MASVFTTAVDEIERKKERKKDRNFHLLKALVKHLKNQISNNSKWAPSKTKL